MNSSAKPITIRDVEYVAKLARLEFSNDEKKLYARQLNEILAYVGKLKEVNTADIEPLLRVSDVDNVFREDVVLPSSPVDDILLNAPSKTDSFFAVPNVRRKPR